MRRVILRVGIGACATQDQIVSAEALGLGKFGSAILARPYFVHFILSIPCIAGGADRNSLLSREVPTMHSDFRRLDR